MLMAQYNEVQFLPYSVMGFFFHNLKIYFEFPVSKEIWKCKIDENVKPHLTIAKKFKISFFSSSLERGPLVQIPLP